MALRPIFFFFFPKEDATPVLYRAAGGGGSFVPTGRKIELGVAQKKQEGLRGCWSMFPLTRVPFWCRFFEPQPFDVAPSDHGTLFCHVVHVVKKCSSLFP